MDTIRTLLRQPSSSSVYLRRPMGVAEGDEVGGAQRVEIVQPEMEDELEAEPNSDVTALVLRHRRGYRRVALYLCLCGAVVFISAFLLGYAVFRGQCHSCGQAGVQEDVDEVGANHSGEGGGNLYLGELREMLKKYLQDHHIEKTVRRVSRSSHPSGSLEGNILATEILQSFKQLKMDHTWTDSHYATLQFPDRGDPSRKHNCGTFILKPPQGQMLHQPATCPGPRETTGRWHHKQANRRLLATGSGSTQTLQQEPTILPGKKKATREENNRARFHNVKSDELSEREKKKQRDKWKAASRGYRERKTMLDLTPPSMENTPRLGKVQNTWG